MYKRQNKCCKGRKKPRAFTIIISIVIVIISILVSPLVIYYINMNLPIPQTVELTDVRTGTIWEYEENGNKLVLKNYENNYIAEVKNNTELLYYDIGFLQEAGKYKYSMAFHKYKNNKNASEYTTTCIAYFYEDSIKISLDEEAQKALKISKKEILLNKISERGDAESNEYSNSINAVYKGKAFLSQKQDFGMYMLENKRYIPGTPQPKSKTLEGIFKNNNGKEEHFYVFGMFSNGGVSTVALRGIYGLSPFQFSEEPLDEYTYAICDFINKGSNVIVRVKKSNNDSFSEGDEFVIYDLDIKEYEYSDFTDAVENAKLNEILKTIRQFSD